MRLAMESFTEVQVTMLFSPLQSSTFYETGPQVARSGLELTV